jgi:hypothetical protein
MPENAINYGKAERDLELNPQTVSESEYAAALAAVEANGGIELRTPAARRAILLAVAEVLRAEKGLNQNASIEFALAKHPKLHG